MPLLEVRIPISPTPAFLNRVRLIAASLRQWYPDTVVTVSCYPPMETAKGAIVVGSRWNLAGGATVDFRYVATADFNRWAGTRSPYLATVMDTWKPPFYGDYILHLDADVIPIRPFPEWFAERGLCGVMAHVPSLSDGAWSMLFRDYGVTQPRFVHEYTGGGIMCQAGTVGPLYFNSGVVFGRRELFERIAEPTLEAIDFLAGQFPDSYWFDQQALALGIAASGVPAKTFPLRYNFPNRPAFDRAHPEELADMRFCHAMQTDVVDRDSDFESDAALDALCARTDLDGSNEVLRQRVSELR
jgi:hypothetical protein